MLHLTPYPLACLPACLRTWSSQINLDLDVEKLDSVANDGEDGAGWWQGWIRGDNSLHRRKKAHS